MRRALRPAHLAMALLVLLASMGVGYAAWTDSLSIRGDIATGTVDAAFIGAFSDDDGAVDDGALDGGDTGGCAGTGTSSCDPAAGGPDPKARRTYDAAGCDASVTDPEVARVALSGAYPGYVCTVWLDVANDGSVPVAVATLTVGASVAEPATPTDLDLDGDGTTDLRLEVGGFDLCDAIDPGETLRLRVVHEVMAPTDGTALTFDATIGVQQWNAPCPPDG